ncbi:oligosaccharide flippase family protein [Muricoccus radiodurans]|uniref:oligosaccharide flippase family protein n=1 Tax=Muricoccus radiodurans TaxID=2231721 RepID=UPI003CF495AC
MSSPLPAGAAASPDPRDAEAGRPLAAPAVGPDHGLGRKVAKSAAIMVLGRLATRVVSVISTLLLVRLLLPADFGLVALAAAAFVIADIVTATSYGLVLVRRATVDRALYDTAWTMNLLRCLLLGGLVAVTADMQAALLGDPRIAPVLSVVALTVSLDGLVSIGMARLQREFRFGEIFRYQVTAKLLSFVLTIALAVLFRSYWCLVLGNLFAKLLLIPLSYYLAPHRPRLSLEHWRELFGFSRWMFATNLCMAADGQGPNLVLGRIGGIEAVGMYNVSYQIAATPVTELAAPVRAPIYSGYARVLGDLAALRDQHLDGFAFLSALTVPLSVGIALTAPEWERLALGPAWAGAAPMIAICALYALVDSLSHFTFNVFTVLDRQRLFVAIYATLGMIRVPAIIAGGLLAGPWGTLSAMLATGVVNVFVWHWQTGRLLGHAAAIPFLRLGRTVAAAVTMTAAVLLLRSVWPAIGNSSLEAFARLLTVAALGASVHILTQILLWRIAGRPAGVEQTLVTLLAQTVQRRRERRATSHGWARVLAPLLGRPREPKRPLRPLPALTEPG